MSRRPAKLWHDHELIAAVLIGILALTVVALAVVGIWATRAL